MRSNIKRILWVVLIVIIALASKALFEYVYNFYASKYLLAQFFNVVFHYTVTGVAILIWIGIVASSKTTPSKLPWLILLLFEPFIGLSLFLTFGRNFKRSRRFRTHPLIHDGKYLTNEPTTDFNDQGYLDIDSEITDIYKTAYNITSHHAYLNNSKASVLTNGKEFFPRLIKEIKAAEKYILMEYYIIRTDRIGKKVLNLLIKKAEEGVEVKLIYDSIGSVMLNKKFVRNLKKSKVKVVANDRVYFGLFNTRINYRNHRKITIIDGKYGFIGGMNLADEYNNGVKKFGHFRDTHLVLEGLVINSLTSLFFRDWYYNTNIFIEDSKYYNALKVDVEGLVQIIPSGPDFHYPPIRNTYVKMINNAKISIKIMTPYLALDQQMLTSLIIASKGGVKVDIIIPGIPDRKSVYLVTKSFIGELLDAGINIYFYKKGFTHAKVLISDDTLASCGTYNLDNRSAIINFEATALLYKTGVDKLIKDFNKDLSISKQVNPKRWGNRGITSRIVEGMFNLFSPLV